MRRAGRVLSAAAFAMALCSSGVGQAVAVTAADVAAAAAERATYGLPSDEADVRSIMESGRDVGTARWGIVLTEEEAAELDLDGRMAFQFDAIQQLLPVASALPTYGGAFFEPANDGRLVVLLTERDSTVESKLAELSPGEPGAVEFRLADLPYSVLTSAFRLARTQWEALADGRILPAVSIDEASSSLVFQVLPEDLSWADAMRPEFQERLGVPVSFIEGRIAPGDVCDSRDNCFNPLKAGVRIYKGGVQNSVGTCTMGFHITTSQGDEQFLTSGHCRGGDFHSWYHPNYGLIGNEGATIFVSGGYDGMRVHMADNQASNDVYGSFPISGSVTPWTGMSVCGSMGRGDIVDCGTVTDDWLSYWMWECFCNVDGADQDGIVREPGDSGSPIVLNYIQNTSYAVGIHSNADGRFARVADLLIHWNSTVVDS